MAVYLLHFASKIAHAQHYLGYAKKVDERIAKHRSGNGARLVAVFMEQGIDFEVARVWPKGDRTLERRLKNWKKARDLCPICKYEQTTN